MQAVPAAPAPAPAGPTAEEMTAMVESAVKGAVPEGTSAEEIKSMVEAAVGAASQDAVTADQVRSLVAEAVATSATEGPEPLSADEVRQIVSAAVSALPTPEARVVTKEVTVTEVKEVTGSRQEVRHRPNDRQCHSRPGVRRDDSPAPSVRAAPHRHIFHTPRGDGLRTELPNRSLTRTGA